MVELVNCFEVPNGQEDKFFELWKNVNSYMVTKPGYVKHRLLRSLAPDARFRFVNLAEWESPAALQAGHDQPFRDLVSAPAWSSFTSTSSLYDPVHTGDIRIVR